MCNGRVLPVRTSWSWPIVSKIGGATFESPRTTKMLTNFCYAEIVRESASHARSHRAPPIVVDWLAWQGVIAYPVASPSAGASPRAPDQRAFAPFGNLSRAFAPLHPRPKSLRALWKHDGDIRSPRRAKGFRAPCNHDQRAFEPFGYLTGVFGPSDDQGGKIPLGTPARRVEAQPRGASAKCGLAAPTGGKPVTTKATRAFGQGARHRFACAHVRTRQGRAPLDHHAAWRVGMGV